MAAARAPLNVTLHGAPTAATAQLHSPWHSPIPYLFGGLAAMLGLIAFALLILACSYWKLSGYLEGEPDRDLEAGEKDDDSKPPAPMEDKILVIMAGQAKPTYLATPSSSRSSSFGDRSTSCSSCGAGRIDKLVEMEKQSTSERFQAHTLTVLPESVPEQAQQTH